MGDDFIDEEGYDHDYDVLGFSDDPYEECEHCGDNALEGDAWQCKCDGDRIFCGETCFDKWHVVRQGGLPCQTIVIPTV